jgi:hypothetical protein
MLAAIWASRYAAGTLSALMVSTPRMLSTTMPWRA